VTRVAVRDTGFMRILTTPALPTPVPRAARWTVAGVVTAFALGGLLQEHRHPAVATAAVLVTVAAAVLMNPDQRVLLPVLAVVSAAGLAVVGTGEASDVGWFGVCVLVGWCAFIGGTPVAAALWLAFVVMFGLEWLLTTDDHGWASWIAGTTFAAFGCLLARRERDLAQRLRAAQAGLAERARAEERNRIARELHDIIAHSLTVSLLHVSGARLAVAENSADAIEALAEAERLGRECLTEVRQVVGLLRHDETASVAPLPDAAQLTTLVEQFRQAGAKISLDGPADTSGLTATAGLALYRILQEALTNAARHAPAALTQVTLTVTESSAVLVVQSAGPPGSGHGSGLLNMRERAEALGGTCAAGPAAGGWRVRAEIPVAPGAPAMVSP
jgi:signal transduction histidine kinase